MIDQLYDIGDKVKHKVFGEGIILDIEGFSDSVKLTIQFKEKSSKVIMSKYVKLIKK